MKAFSYNAAANDDGLLGRNDQQSGGVVRDLIRHRVQLPKPATRHFQRPALTEKLVTALRPGAILHLEAPAGYGKTSELNAALLALDGARRDVRWLPLTEQDNDPLRFYTLLDVALSGEPDKDSAAQSPAHREGLADDLELLLAQRSEQSQGKVLVLDGVDQVASQASLALLKRLLSHHPANLTVVLISRKSLPIETHCFELEGRFTRVTGDGLELSRAETAEFFQPSLQANHLTQVAVEHLYSLTEGWMTPLALYQLELQSCEAGRPPIQEARSVVSFLQGAVTERLTAGQRRSLSIMAEMEVVSDDLFLAIADSQCDREFLPSSAVAFGLPVRSIANRRRWYRMVPLVREWLLATPVAGREARATLASEWFSNHGQFSEALRYALVCHDRERAGRVAAEGSEALLVGQDTASLLKLRQSLPVELICRSPRLQVVFSWVHALGGQLAEARALIDGISGTDQKILRGRLAASKVFLLSGEGRVEDALAESEAALQETDLTPHGRLMTLLVKSNALCALGQLNAAREAHREAAKLARQSGDNGAELLAVYAHSRIELSKGALRHAEHLLRTGLDAANNEAVRPPRVGEARLMLNLALVLWHQGRVKEADRLLVGFIRNAEKGRDLVLLVAMALRVLISKSQGHLDDAFSWIGQAERTMQAWLVDDVVYVPVLEALKVSCWLAQGQVDSAAQGMRKLQPYRNQHRVFELFPMMPDLLDTLDVRLALAEGRYEEALRLLTDKGDGLLNEAPFGHRLHLGLLRAMTKFRQGANNKAFGLLGQVVDLAAPEQYLSPFVELGAEIRDMVVQGLTGMARTPFTDRLRAVYGLKSAVGDQQKSAELPEPISDREFGVLELIAMGLSNQGIADKLHISLHTVKTHARRINAKLGVKSRTQAIVRARELGLL